MRIKTRYQGKMRFADGDGPARVIMDAPAAAGGLGEAPTPKAMVLQGLVGCTGLDVAGLLDRAKVPFEDLEVEAEATQTKTTPKVFGEIELTYRIRTEGSNRPAVEKAIRDSQERFCGVSAMLKKTAQLSWKLELEEL